MSTSGDVSELTRRAGGSFGINQMKKSIILPLTDEELIELQRILLDSDTGGALAFLKNHLEKKVSAAIA